MLKIRRIHDITLARDQRALAQIMDILRRQFPYLTEEDLNELPLKIANPFKDGFRHLLVVAEGANRQVRGFASVSHDITLKISYLDFIAVSNGTHGGGVGSVLYESVREESLAAGSIGLFFECFPDDPALVKNPAELKQNIARLRFYERYWALPIAGTAFEAPTTPDADDSQYLMFDDLDQGTRISMEHGKKVARAILERKHGKGLSAAYVDKVVESFHDDPVTLRPPRYSTEQAAAPIRPTVPPSQRITMVVNQKHFIHHVRSRGWVESPVRVSKILEELRKTNLCREVEPWSFPEKHVRAVHDADFVTYLKKMAERLKDGEVKYPYVFPLRNVHRRPRDLPDQVGYYCIDTFTPLSRGAILAARAGVDCALTAAESVLDGAMISYALVRPPGHHAERDNFGGTCYLNNCAIAAHLLSDYGRVAILDVDYHHGNGQQDIFYDRDDVLTVSIHCHPRFAYPLFAGFDDETGQGPGRGFNLNIPLPEHDIDGERYRVALVRALKRILNFKPRFLVVALGVDTAKGDPTGSWELVAKDFELNGRLIGQLKLPTLVVQEGGYRIRDIGRNVASFFRGLWTTMHAPEADMSAFAPQRRSSAAAPANKSKTNES